MNLNKINCIYRFIRQGNLFGVAIAVLQLTTFLNNKQIKLFNYFQFFFVVVISVVVVVVVLLDLDLFFFVVCCCSAAFCDSFEMYR